MNRGMNGEEKEDFCFQRENFIWWAQVEESKCIFFLYASFILHVVSTKNTLSAFLLYLVESFFNFI